jgi:hypothetical protein
MKMSAMAAPASPNGTSATRTCRTIETVDGRIASAIAQSGNDRLSAISVRCRAFAARSPSTPTSFTSAAPKLSPRMANDTARKT